MWDTIDTERNISGKERWTTRKERQIYKKKDTWIEQQKEKINSITNLPLKNKVTMTPQLRILPLLRSLYFRKWVKMECLVVLHMNYQVLNQQPHILWILHLIQIFSQAIYKLLNNNFTPHICLVLTHMHILPLNQKSYPPQVILLIQVCLKDITSWFQPIALPSGASF